MKKLFILILAVIYLTEASGLRLHLHFCMDKLVSWTLIETKRKCSGNNKSKDHLPHLACKDCCKDEYKTAQLDNTYKGEQTFLVKSHSIKATDLFFIKVPVVFFTALRANLIHSSSNKHKVPIYLFNSVFRI
jgi:hypothetical protein